MCGVAGIYAPAGRPSVELVGRMLASIRTRGPDDEGIEAVSEGSLVLGHRRLAIIDLSPLGHQPMRSADGVSWIVFNGEVYNFREIRADLEQRGTVFRSHSDTEVILAACRQWGIEAVERFRGMFAFALWDGERRQLHLARDRFGVKPLYYSNRGGVLAFASELKALHVAGLTTREVDPVAVTEYLQFGYVSAPRSIYADVVSLEPGTVVTFDERLEPAARRYWSLAGLFDSAGTLALRRELDGLPDEALLDRVEDALTEGFRYRMVADVPVGLFLSGGIDSSLVATLLARRGGFRLRTFTIGYGESEFDETRYAREVADRLDAEHTEFIVSPEEALQLNDRLPDIADEPIGDSSLIPTLMVSQLARRHVTVALSADGADELFGGYARYRVCGTYAGALQGVKRWGYHAAAGVLDRVPSSVVSRAYQLTRGGGPKYAGINDKLRKFVRMARSRTVASAYESAVSEWSPGEVGHLYPAGRGLPTEAREVFEAVRTTDPRDAFMHFDAARYLPGDLLTKVDRASMAVSLEAREPCLDHEMARLAVALPMRWKIREGRNKYVLQRILDRHLPAGFFDRPKQGFSAPVGEWLRGPLKAMLQDELSPARVRRFGLLDPAATDAAVSGFLAGDRNASPAGIWFLLQLQRWAGRWQSPPPVVPGAS